MANRKYSDGVRAEVIAALLAGQSIRSVAKEYRIPEGTVSSWKRSLSRPLDNMHDAQKKEMGELIVAGVEFRVTVRPVQK